MVSSLAFLVYAAVGIDKLSEYYIGYFYWSAPLVTVLVIVLAGLEAVPRRWAALSTGVAVLAAAAAFAMLAVIPGTRTSTNDIDESLPQVVATLAARAPGRTIVLHIDGPAWVETTGFLVQAERSGVRACLHDPWYTFLMTRQFICTPAQTASGQAYWFYTPHGLPPHTAGHPALQRHRRRSRVTVTHLGRAQEAPAVTALPARTSAATLAKRAGLVVLAAAVLFFCYWRQSQAVPLSSDGGGNVLQAWDMLHGNLLLHHWWVSDVSFYTTELPQYMLIEALTGLGPWVVHVAAAMTYTLLVLLAALLAKGNARGGKGRARALLAAGLMLAPQLSATSILLLSPDHIGTAVPLLVIWLLIDRAPDRAGTCRCWCACCSP